MRSTSASVVSTCSAPRSGAATAASSPAATMRDGGGAGNLPRMCSMSARSPGVSPAALPRELNGAGLPDDRDLDLSRVLELVLDAARDVLRQPDRRFIRYAVALDHDPDL